MQRLTEREDKKMDNLKMIEKSIKQSEDYPTESELWQRLPRRIPRRALKHFLRHLEVDMKIMYGKGRKIIWTEADEFQSKMLKEELQS
jgi:hypothetical protein